MPSAVYQYNRIEGKLKEGRGHIYVDIREAPEKLSCVRKSAGKPTRKFRPNAFLRGVCSSFDRQADTKIH